jgi:hypothetical protein
MQSSYEEIQSEFTISTDLLEDKTMEYNISCPICLNVAFSSVSCAGCHHLFCKKCIEDWRLRNPKCPNDHEFKEAQVDPLAKKFINSIKIKCINVDKGCTKVICFSDYLDHVRRECEFSLLKCLGCGMVANKNIMKMHVNICECIEEKCPFCSLCLARKNMSSHLTTCESRQIECEFCENKIFYNRKDQHLLICEERSEECSLCKTKVKKKIEHLHTKELCFKIYATILNKNNVVKNSQGDLLEKVTRLEEENSELKKKLLVANKEKNISIDEIKNLKNTIQSLNLNTVQLEKNMQEYKNGYEQWKAYSQKLETDINNSKKNNLFGNLQDNSKTQPTNIFSSQQRSNGSNPFVFHEAHQGIFFI